MAGVRLDRKIAVERYSVTKNKFNEEEKVWVELMSTWASVTPISDGERWRAGATGAIVSDRVVILWTALAATIGVKDRFVYGGKTFDIHGIKEIGRRKRLELTASAVVPNG